MMKKINLKYLVFAALLMTTLFSGVGKVAEARIAIDGSNQPTVPVNAFGWTSESASSDTHSLYLYAKADDPDLGTGIPESLYKSTDGGVTWNPVASLAQGYYDLIQQSSNGVKVAVAAAYNNVYFGSHQLSYIYTSGDSGATWATSTALGSKKWGVLSMSSDGSKIIANQTVTGYLYYSTSSGATWATSTNAGSKLWASSYVSADGSKIFATQSNSLYTSSDGITFASTTIAGAGAFVGVSYLGGKIFARTASLLYTSTDNGTTWASSTISTFPSTSNVSTLEKMVGSQDGTYLYTPVSYRSTVLIFYSNDGGVTWKCDSTVGSGFYIISGPSSAFFGVSADGLKIYTNGIFETVSYTTPIFSATSTSYSTSTASISYTTDKQATSTLSYGLAPSVYTGTISTSTASTSSSFNITTLIPCTTYNYKYDVTDIYGNPATSPNYSFKTSGCIANTTYTQSTSTAISNLGTLNLNNLHLTIPSGFSATTTTAQFEATELATSTVISILGKPAKYNLFNSLYQLQAMPTATSTLSTFTNPLYITLTYDPTTLGVTDPSTLTIFSTEGATWSQLSSCVVDTTLHTVTCPTTHFSTFGIFGLTIPASITNTAIQVSGTSATISWNTDKGATTGLNYGINNALTTSTTTDSSFTATVHSITLPNLTYGTTYYYQITSTDADSNTSTTSVMSFTTSADPSIVIPTTSSVSSSGGGSYPAALFAKLLDSSVKTNDNLGCVVGNLFNTNTGKVCDATNGITNTPASTPSSAFTFTKDLKLGMRNNDVLQLQKFLNSNGFIIAKTGAGSQGKETTYFGPATKSALVKFQKSVGLPNTGFFGGMTRNVIKTKIN